MSNDTGKIKAAAPPQPTPPKSHWYRLHRSTKCIGCLTLIVLIMVVYPGAFLSDPVDPFFVDYQEFWPINYNNIVVHGWPWPFLARYDPLLDSGPLAVPHPLKNPPWATPGCWMLWGNWGWFSVGGLVGDFLLVLVLVAAVTTYFERRRRNGIRLWQCTLKEMMLFTLLLAISLSYWQPHRLRRQLELKTIYDSPQYLYNGDENFFDFVCPAFFRKLLGDRFLNDFLANKQLIVFIKNDEPEWIRSLNARPHVSWMEIRTDKEENILSDNFLEAIRKCSSLKKIGIMWATNVDAICSSLASLQELKMIRFSSMPLTASSIQELKKLPRLESLEILDNLPQDASPTLAELQHLRSLSLWRVELNETGLKKLISSTSLEKLSFCYVPLDNSSIIILGRMNQLKELEIINSEMTRQDIDDLRKLLPRCKITSNVE